MPRVTRQSSLSAVSKAKPYSKPAQSKTVQSRTKGASEADASSSSGSVNVPVPAKRAARDSKDPKASHLYTDDNPSTTIHGTGFKDAAKARETLSLVSKRSLLYQWQTINTMYHRAAHHPRISGSTDMQAAQTIFRTWLDETYPAAKNAQLQFPMLKKDVIEAYLPTIETLKDSEGYTWAQKYAALSKGKRLANVLMDEQKPEERDMAVVRQQVLEDIVKTRGNRIPGKQDADFLWRKGEPYSGLSQLHLRCVSYGWSPCGVDILMKALSGSVKSP